MDENQKNNQNSELKCLKQMQNKLEQMLEYFVFIIN